MNIQVWTAQMAKHHLAKELDLEFIDTTYMTGVDAGNGVLAPSKEMVHAYKDGHLPAGEYVDLYWDRMDTAMQTDEGMEYWRKLFDKAYRPLVFACYCAGGKFCHRHPLVDYFTAHANGAGFTVQYMGELTTREAYETAIQQPPAL